METAAQLTRHSFRGHDEGVVPKGNTVANLQHQMAWIVGFAAVFNLGAIGVVYQAGVLSHSKSTANRIVSPIPL